MGRRWSQIITKLVQKAGVGNAAFSRQWCSESVLIRLKNSGMNFCLRKTGKKKSERHLQVAGSGNKPATAAA
jgi:hypothetical protein